MASIERETEQERLGRIEAVLLAQLETELPRVAEGSEPLYFFTVDHNPLKLPEHQLSRNGAAAYGLARDALALRRRLSQPLDGPAALFIAAVKRHADVADRREDTAKRTAAELLEALRRDRPKSGPARR